ncbi:MAG TPA: hypothetical protein DCZ95_18730 [Verrucomicrobia bacterium]|nr:MAG: hypothetical protein A2X46_16975 [Lentisphaerae bacterium GWF2_57_35]HBA86125.1 hypothetical protein [Verrucomicrobiota bacterium]
MDQDQEEREHFTAVVVSNDPDQIRSITATLGSDGFKIISFTHAEEALKYMEGKPSPSIIIANLHIPGIDGWRFCRLIRSSDYPHLQQTALLIVSDTVTGDYARQISIELGANGFLASPFQPEELRTHVRAAMEKMSVPPSLNVLVVEDTQTQSRLLVALFKARGYTVFSASTGAEAIQQFHRVHPDIVVLDYHLPDTHGDQLLAEFKSSQSSAVVIMLTIDKTPDLATRCISLGADAMLRKPVDSDSLVAACEMARREQTLLRVKDLLELRNRELKDSEERFRSLFESIPESVLVHDAEGRILLMNEVCARRLEWPVHHLIGRKLNELVAQEFAPRIETNVRHTFSGGFSLFETTFMTRSGRPIRAEVSERLIDYDGQKAILSISRDITARHSAEEALRQSEARFRNYFELSLVGIAITSSDLRCLEVNDKLCDILGYSREELLQMTWTEITHPSDLNDELVHYSNLSDGEKQDDIREKRFLRKDGQVISVRISTRWIRGQDDAPDYIIAVVEDITDRKHAEQALMDSQRTLSTLLSNLPGMAYRHRKDPLRTLEFASEGCMDLTGYTAEDLLLNKRTSFHELIHPDDRNRVHQTINESIAASKPYLLVYRLLAASGRIKWVSEHGRLVVDPNTNIQALEGFITDITEQKTAELEKKKIEAQIQHAQKLESLGVLTGGLAHDFNNLLVGILGNIDLALLDLPALAPGRQRLEDIKTAGVHATELIKQMLAYSGKGQFAVTTLDLNDLVREMSHLLQASISKKAILRASFADNLPPIEADAVQMRQVVMNLIINASDALDEHSGVITLNTGVMEADRNYLTETYLDDNLPEGYYAYLEVTDSGCGMTKETMTRLFDPFFTTKTKGRGLGLSAVLGIIRGHRGAIKVYSEIGKGTSFKVLFPCSNQAVKTPRKKSAGLASMWKGAGIVLVVDDEDSVRSVTKMMLEKAGFKVLTASDGREGVDVFTQNSDKISAVLLDMTMPHMDGNEAFQEMRRIRADIPVILSSGYNEQDAIMHFAADGLAGFIQKPFQMKGLLDVFQAVLSPKAPAS